MTISGNQGKFDHIFLLAQARQPAFRHSLPVSPNRFWNQGEP
jgi:hypothetical protein